MPKQFDERLQLFSNSNASHLQQLTQIQRGIEKESLRIDPTGKLAQTRHPAALGSALTHPYITTDFSEALLEFITPVDTGIDSSLACLADIHRFTYSQLPEELLWCASMPCILEGDNNIPVARYGSSNIATMKTTYRLGLGHRYGRLMQTIAGIHYNFSLPDSLWQALQQQDMDNRPLADYKTDAYFKLIRNFQRFSWLLVYLYGASPAVCKSFLRGRSGHSLQSFDDGSYHLPHATALRMGDLGYQSDDQQHLNICYNAIDTYIATLQRAITDIHPRYAAIGIKGDKDDDDEYRQLSAALLQIENEFYSPIRPKRVTESGETPLGALKERGVQYIEVRCIDLNPYLPLGIDADQIRFLDSFLLYCLFERSPQCDDADRARIDGNLRAVVNRGRQPDLLLETRRDRRSVPAWGDKLLTGIEAIARLLDDAHGGEDYQRVCRQQRDKLADPDLTPSAKILADMEAQQLPFARLAMQLSKQHQQAFQNEKLDQQRLQYFIDQSLQSLHKQTEIEAADRLSFDEFLANYYRQYDQL